LDILTGKTNKDAKYFSYLCAGTLLATRWQPQITICIALRSVTTIPVSIQTPSCLPTAALHLTAYN